MFKDLVKACRSYRGYDESRKVTREELMEFVDCARLTPASSNKQVLKYLLVTDQEKVDLVQSLTGWGGGLKDRHLPDPGKHPTAFIIICQDLEVESNPTRFLKDVGIAAQTMQLAATDCGLGGIMLGSFNLEGIKKAFALPETILPQLVMAFGKPAETIVLVEANKGENVKYYRDENDVHYVPKRKLEDILL